MAHQSSELKPFDDGYDYEADKDIVEQLLAVHPLSAARDVATRAAGEIRALRAHVKLLDRRNDELAAELNCLHSEEGE
jgi:hypothetical protein